MAITIKKYQDFTPKTFVVPDEPVSTQDAYLFAGLAAEAGEVAGNFAKYCRGDFGVEELIYRTKKELGDVFYFAFQLATQIGLDVEDILEANKEKLEKRLAENKIKGDGEER